MTTNSIIKLFLSQIWSCGRRELPQVSACHGADQGAQLRLRVYPLRRQARPGERGVRGAPRAGGGGRTAPLVRGAAAQVLAHGEDSEVLLRVEIRVRGEVRCAKVVVVVVVAVVV